MGIISLGMSHPIQYNPSIHPHESTHIILKSAFEHWDDSNVVKLCACMWNVKQDCWIIQPKNMVLMVELTIAINFLNINSMWVSSLLECPIESTPTLLFCLYIDVNFNSMWVGSYKFTNLYLWISMHISMSMCMYTCNFMHMNTFISTSRGCVLDYMCIVYIHNRYMSILVLISM